MVCALARPCLNSKQQCSFLHSTFGNVRHKCHLREEISREKRGGKECIQTLMLNAECSAHSIVYTPLCFFFGNPCRVASIRRWWLRKANQVQFIQRKAIFLPQPGHTPPKNIIITAGRSRYQPSAGVLRNGHHAAPNAPGGRARSAIPLMCTWSAQFRSWAYSPPLSLSRPLARSGGLRALVRCSKTARRARIHVRRDKRSEDLSVCYAAKTPQRASYMSVWMGPLGIWGARAPSFLIHRPARVISFARSAQYTHTHHHNPFGCDGRWPRCLRANRVSAVRWGTKKKKNIP